MIFKKLTAAAFKELSNGVTVKINIPVKAKFHTYTTNDRAFPLTYLHGFSGVAVWWHGEINNMARFDWN